MKKLHVSLILIFTILFGGLFVNTSYAEELQKSELSKKYQEWLQLSEEEKKETIAPPAYNIRNKEKVKSLNSIIKALIIPNKYDLRTDTNNPINVIVKNQMNTQLCWGFAATSVVETTLAKQGEILDFSERHIEYNTASNFSNGTNEFALNRTVDSGGYFSTAFTYYSRGTGPILEEDMPFENNALQIKISELPKNVTVKKVDDIVYFPNIYKRLDNKGNLIYEDGNGTTYTNEEILEIRNQIKEHIINYGAIKIDIYAPNYNDKSSNLKEPYSNHAVTVIGWDDNYSKSNFTNVPKEDGAYIVLNSWGEEFGENGVYYISYEDSLVESAMVGVKGISDIEYDNLYQYDISEMWHSLEYKYAGNLYKSKEDEKLTEIMVGSLSDQVCNIYLSDETMDVSKALKIANNVQLNPGYNTIKIQNEIKLSKGDNFSIIVELISNNFKGVGIEDNNDVWFGNAKSNIGESFISTDGTNWEDIYN